MISSAIFYKICRECANIIREPALPSGMLAAYYWLPAMLDESIIGK